MVPSEKRRQSHLKADEISTAPRYERMLPLGGTAVIVPPAISLLDLKLAGAEMLGLGLLAETGLALNLAKPSRPHSSLAAVIPGEREKRPHACPGRSGQPCR
jgi:hypothetical protein